MRLAFEHMVTECSAGFPWYFAKADNPKSASVAEVSVPLLDDPALSLTAASKTRCQPRHFDELFTRLHLRHQNGTCSSIELHRSAASPLAAVASSANDVHRSGGMRLVEIRETNTPIEGPFGRRPKWPRNSGARLVEEVAFFFQISPRDSGWEIPATLMAR